MSIGRVIRVVDRAAYEAVGWQFMREVGDDRVAMEHADDRPPDPFARKRRPKSNVGAYVDAGDGWFYLRTPYNADFVDELKTRVGYGLRKWDPKRKLWKVCKDGWRTAAEIIKKHYPDITFTAQAEAALTELMVDEIESPDLVSYMTLGVRTDSPPIVIHAAITAIIQCWTNLHADDRVAFDDVPLLDDALVAYQRICKHRDIPIDPDVTPELTRLSLRESQ